MLLRKVSRSLAFAVLALVGVSVAAAQQASPGAFTAAQAAAGRAAYQQSCASCHLPDLRGSNEAPPLAGGNFLTAWRTRTTADLFNRVHNTMPATNPGSLSEQDALNIVAYILQVNGAAAGPQALIATSSLAIGDIASGRPAAAPVAAQAPAAAEPAAARPARPAGPPPGLTAEGEVKNYVPVTDDMLLHPDPSDWLMVRGNYQAWNHSSLTQIDRSNVRDLRLAWVWSMNEGGANEPTPLVHNGIIYIANTDNIVQALDGRTGDLIWENRVRPAGQQGGGTGATRNMAIYQDKIFMATTDAHLIALDARTGRMVWDTMIADNTKGFGNSSGPIVIRGKVLQGLERLRSLQGARKRARLLRQRLRSGDRQAALEIQHHCARWRARR